MDGIADITLIYTSLGPVTLKSVKNSNSAPKPFPYAITRPAPAAFYAAILRCTSAVLCRNWEEMVLVHQVALNMRENCSVDVSVIQYTTMSWKEFAKQLKEHISLRRWRLVAGKAAIVTYHS